MLVLYLSREHQVQDDVQLRVELQGKERGFEAYGVDPTAAQRLPGRLVQRVPEDDRAFDGDIGHRAPGDIVPKVTLDVKEVRKLRHKRAEW